METLFNSKPSNRKKTSELRSLTSALDAAIAKIEASRNKEIKLRKQTEMNKQIAKNLLEKINQLTNRTATEGASNGEGGVQKNG